MTLQSCVEQKLRFLEQMKSMYCTWDFTYCNSQLYKEYVHYSNVVYLPIYFSSKYLET